MKLLASAAAPRPASPRSELIAGPALSASEWRPRPWTSSSRAALRRYVPRAQAGKRFPASWDCAGAATSGPPWRCGAGWRAAAGAAGRRRSTLVALDPGRGEPAPRGLSAPVGGRGRWRRYRLSRPVSGLRLHFVNVRGTATAADRAQTAIRRAAGPWRLLRGGSACAAEPQPAIVPREDWGADDCPPRAAPDYGTVKSTLRPPHRQPERLHARRGALDRAGHLPLPPQLQRLERPRLQLRRRSLRTIYEGRAGGVDQAVVGAQAQGYNAQEHRDGQPRHVFERPADTGGARRDGAADPLEAAAPRRPDVRIDHAGERRRGAPTATRPARTCG